MERKITQRDAFLLWLPLAAMWIIMASEAPLVQALVARLPNPKINLAAFGVAFHFLIIVESPILMLMSAATALAKGRVSYTKLRNFSLFLSGAMSLLLFVFVFSGYFLEFAIKVMRLEPEIAILAAEGLLIFSPCPFLVGMRRFYQGVLIRSGRGKLVAQGSLARLFAASAVGFTLFFGEPIDGAILATTTLASSMLAEGIYTRYLSQASISKLLEDTSEGEDAISYSKIASFYVPLAATSVVNLATFPVITFFLTMTPLALASLAIWPVLTSFSFLFLSISIACQEVVIAQLGEKHENIDALRDFCIRLAIGVTFVYGLVVYTPFYFIVFEGPMGLTPELARFARNGALLMAITPLVSVALSWNRAILVQTGRTLGVTLASFVDLAVVAVGMAFFASWGGVSGVVAAAISLVVGRGAGAVMLYLSRNGSFSKPIRLAQSTS